MPDRFEEAAANHAAHAEAKARRRAERLGTLTERHRPGTVYSCDARRFGADLRLCPVHQHAPGALRTILAITEDQRSPEAMIAAIQLVAKKALEERF